MRSTMEQMQEAAGATGNDANEASRVKGIVVAIAVPHPPLIVPSVGKGEESAIQSTIDAYRKAARSVAEAKPDVIVLTSPHAPLFRDGFFVSDASEVYGDMGRFRAPQTAIDYPGDPEFADQLSEIVEEAGIPVVRESALYACEPGSMHEHGVDHATFVPLYFISQEIAGVPVVRIGLSGLDEADHQKMGRAIAKVANEQGKRVAFVASGDLSHKLKSDGPYGFDPAGPVFDGMIGDIFQTGELDRLFALDSRMCEDAAECGLRSFQIMAAALEEQSNLDNCDRFESNLLSLEGPFGVGYAVATFKPVNDIPDNDDVDPYVRLARESVEGYVRQGTPISRPATLPSDMIDRRAGVFVSLHKEDGLRGCIGTIAATKDNIADEIIANAVSACSRDPRFLPVREDELDYISYSVDALSEPEPIASIDDLDVKRYGVIVAKGWRRGLLLPNLEGVDSVEVQLAIAKEKAGIDPYEEDVELERFEVVRHIRGGEARR